MRVDPVYLFIHGFGGCAELWAAQARHFSARGRVIAVDLPGHGGTPWNGETLSGMAAHVARLMGPSPMPRQVIAVANSFGGLVALELWKLYPQAFRSMTLVGSLPRFTFTPGFPAGLDGARIRKFMAQLEGDVPSVLEMFFRSLFSPEERASSWYGFIKQARQQAVVPSRETLHAFLRILGTADLRETLGIVDVPVQFVLGDKDPICPLAVVGPLREICPSARVDIMTGCGHFPFLSRSDEFNALLEGFSG